MAKIRGYIAASLDGFIAGEADDMTWLQKYDDMDLGEHAFPAFLQSIQTVVMGRATYDFVANCGFPWPYGDKRAYVVTSRPIEKPAGPLEICQDVDTLISQLRALDDGDVWVVGGGRLQMAFLEHGALDEIEIYLMPELIGGGVPLFPAIGLKASPRLASVQAMDRGCVRLHYVFASGETA